MVVFYFVAGIDPSGRSAGYQNIIDACVEVAGHNGQAVPPAAPGRSQDLQLLLRSAKPSHLRYTGIKSAVC